MRMVLVSGEYVKTHQFYQGSRYKKEELCESFKGLMNIFFAKAEKIEDCKRTW